MTPELQEWICKVRVELARKNLTRTKLAYGIGVSKPVISDLLNYGKGSQNLIHKINAFLGIK